MTILRLNVLIILTNFSLSMFLHCSYFLTISVPRCSYNVRSYKKVYHLISKSIYMTSQDIIIKILRGIQAKKKKAKGPLESFVTPPRHPANPPHHNHPPLPPQPPTPPCRTFPTNIHSYSIFLSLFSLKI